MKQVFYFYDDFELLMAWLKLITGEGLHFGMLNSNSTVDGLRDGSVKPGEDYGRWLCAGLGTDSPN